MDNAQVRATKRTESLTLRTLGRKHWFLQAFGEDVVRCHIRRQGVRSYLYTYHDGWDYGEGYAPRAMESVVLGNEHLVQDVARFRKSKQGYARLGVPYYRGYLLYGPSGTGKTSLVSALAARSGSQFIRSILRILTTGV
jgi:mitochondrial chaperone BCS1